jgi:predicted RNA binding protein YcfA (HicA-like mRNA interferase family)
MMKRRKLLKRLSQRHLRNVAFGDIINMVEGFGFRLVRTSSSHHIFTHPAIQELVNLQEVKGEAKPYKIRQFLRLVEMYNLRLEDEE